MRAHVNEIGIVVSEFGDQSREWWKTLLDKLKSQHLPGRYQYGKRMLAGAPKLGDATIYFTENTVSEPEAVEILKQSGFEVFQPPR